MMRSARSGMGCPVQSGPVLSNICWQFQVVGRRRGTRPTQIGGGHWRDGTGRVRDGAVGLLSDVGAATKRPLTVLSGGQVQATATEDSLLLEYASKSTDLLNRFTSDAEGRHPQTI